MGKLNTLGIAHDFAARRIQPGNFCIDATAGRGKDTAFLCELVGAEGRVIAFDIQEEAVESTKCLLEEKGLSEIAEVHLCSHTEMNRFAEPETVDGILFNLGYLPGGRHDIFTRPDSSIPAINQALTLIRQGGFVSVCVYYGGDSGYEEKDALMEYFKTIDQRQFTVLVTQFMNRVGDPPIAVFILKEI